MTEGPDRETLRLHFDALMDALDELRARRSDRQSTDYQAAQFGFIQRLAEFCADVLGEERHFDQGQRTDLQQILFTVRAWWPVFRDDGKSAHELWSRFLDELHRLEYGDVPILLSPTGRRRGQHELAARLHQTRLYALQIDAFLKQRNRQPSSYRSLIEKAFGADWDRIRKWKQLAEIGLGRDIVEIWMNAASAGDLDWLSLDEIESSILQSASEYREVAGLPPLPNDWEN